MAPLPCRNHVPLATRIAMSQAEACDSAHTDLDHAGQRCLWRLGRGDEIGPRYLRRLEES